MSLPSPIGRVSTGEETTLSLAPAPHQTTLLKHGFSFLHQWILSMFFLPQGPLSWDSFPNPTFTSLLLSSSPSGTPSLSLLLSVLSAALPSPLPAGWEAWRAPQLHPALLTLVAGVEDRMEQVFKDGYILFTAQLRLDTKRNVVVFLDPPSVRPSCRFHRTFGSDRFLRLRLDKKLSRAVGGDGRVKEVLRPVLAGRIVLLGRRYRAYWENDGAVYWWCEKGPKVGSMGLKEFLDAHIDSKIIENGSLTWAKMKSRWGLGHSSTVATVVIPREDVALVPDLESDSLLISYATMSAIAKRMGLKRMPSCIRGSYHGVHKVFALDYTTWPPTPRSKPLVDLPPTPPLSSEPSLPAPEAPPRSSAPLSLDSSDPLLWLEAWDLQRDGSPFRPRVLEIDFVVRDLGANKPLKLRVSLEGGMIRWRTRTAVEVEGVVMTDGCGQISDEVVREKMCEVAVPEACQARLGPGKGMLTTPPRQDARTGIWAELRDSQVKYFDRRSTEFVLEVLMCPKPATSAKIGKQYLEILSCGGVPNAVFLELLKDQVNDATSDLFDGWEKPTVMLGGVYRTSGISQERRMRITRVVDPTAFRRSLSDMSFWSEDEPSEFGDPNEYLLGNLDPYSAAPTTIGEVVVEALQAGFSPAQEPVIAQKIKKLGELVVAKASQAGQIAVPQSANLRVTVDVTGCLAPGEISVRFSEAFVDPTTMRRLNVVTGEVLVTRSPCIVASDIQRVVAVDRPELAHRLDEVVFSRFGDRPLCSLLSGGDHDGDTITVIWRPDIVDAFQNSAVSFADAPFVDSDYMEVDKRKTGSVLNAATTPESLSTALLESLWSPSHFGMVNKYWESLCYHLGVKDPLTCLAGHLFCRLLDGSKQGLSLSTQQHSALRDQLGVNKRPAPAWATFFGKEGPRDTDNSIGFRHKHRSPRHVMDALMDFGQEAKSEYFKQVNKRLRAFPLHVDRDLVAPFRDAVEEAFRNKGSPYWASRLSDLQKIYDQVATTWQSRQPTKKPGSGEFSGKAGQLQQKKQLRKHSKCMWTLISDRTSLTNEGLESASGTMELRRLLASCAYAYPLQKPPLGISTTKRFFSGGDGNFTEVGTTLAWGWAWDVAHREICAIKSGALTARQHSTFIGATAAMGMSAPSVHYPMYISMSVDRGTVNISRKQVITTSGKRPLEGSQEGRSPAKKARTG